jgi:L-iditol 2-dehydrogenase
MGRLLFLVNRVYKKAGQKRGKNVDHPRNPLKQARGPGHSMLAWLLDKQNRIAATELPLPHLQQGDVLVKMEACGICGTDLEKISGQLGPGGILGHEVSGTVQRTIGNPDYSPGDRVIAHHHVPCYKCATCQKGDLTICEEFKKTNIDPCGLAESFRLPEYNVARGALIHLPDQLSFEEGAMIEPTACCIRAINRAHVQERENILIVGLGPTGLTQLQLLRNKTSGKIIGTDILESRLKMGGKLGADETLDPRALNVPEMVRELTVGGVDLALVATGKEKALDQAFASVRKGGRILLFGAPAIGAEYRLDVSTLFSRQISLISSYSCVEPEMHEAMRLVSDKGIKLYELISDRFKLKEADKALEHSKDSRAAIKTLVTP